VNDVLDWMAMFSGPLNSAMVRARERCYDIANSERLLGFNESAATYKEIAEEVSGLALWVNQEETNMMRDGKIPPPEDSPFKEDDVYPDCLSGQLCSSVIMSLGVAHAPMLLS
jgi:hypothetical protein